MTLNVSPIPPATAANPFPLTNVTLNYTLAAPVQRNDTFKVFFPAQFVLGPTTYCFSGDNSISCFANASYELVGIVNSNGSRAGVRAQFTVVNVQLVTVATGSLDQLYLEVDDQFGNVTQFYQGVPNINAPPPSQQLQASVVSQSNENTSAIDTITLAIVIGYVPAAMRVDFPSQISVP